MPIFKKRSIDDLGEKKRDMPEGLWTKCPSCGEYNTVGEFREALQAPGAPPQHNVSPAAVQRSWLSPGSATVLRLAPLATFSSAAAEAWSLGSVELDRLLGGRGLTLGSSTLFSGAPGVGKSTLLLQLAGLLSGASATR
jgi:predicted ATP-dependent serine protease